MDQIIIPLLMWYINVRIFPPPFDPIIQYNWIFVSCLSLRDPQRIVWEMWSSAVRPVLRPMHFAPCTTTSVGVSHRPAMCTSIPLPPQLPLTKWGASWGTWPLTPSLSWGWSWFGNQVLQLSVLFLMSVWIPSNMATPGTSWSVLISRVVSFQGIQSNQATLGNSRSVLIRGVASFLGVNFHWGHFEVATSMQRCSHFRSPDLSWGHCEVTCM